MRGGAATPRLGEQIAVVEEGARAGQDREAVELVAVGAAPREGLEEVLPRLGRQGLVARVEEAVLGVARERVQIEHVGRLVVLDHGADLLIDGVPVDHLQVHLHPGLLGVLLGQALPERAGMVAAVLRDHDLDRLGRVAPAAARAERGRAEEDEGQETAARHRAHTTKVPGGGVSLPATAWTLMHRMDVTLLAAPNRRSPHVTCPHRLHARAHADVVRVLVRPGAAAERVRGRSRFRRASRWTRAGPPSSSRRP